MFRLATFIVLFALSAQGATYYVATYGSDSNSGTSTNAPWLTFNKVNNTVGSGDTVYWLDGIYSGNFWPGKTVGLSNALFAAYPGHRPIFANYDTNASSLRAMLINGTVRNTTFRGLTWSNNWYNVEVAAGRYITFDGCSFGWRNDLTNGSGTGILNDYFYNSVSVNRNAKNVTFTNCYFAPYGTSRDGNDPGCPLSFGALSPDSYSSNCWGHVVVNCVFMGGGHDLIEIYSPSNVIKGNKFFNPNYMIGPDGRLYGNRHISTMTKWAQPTLIEDNDFGWSGIPVDTVATVASFDISSQNAIMRRNRFFANAGPAVAFYDKSAGVPNPADNYFYHNSLLLTALDPYRTLYSGYQSGIVFTHTTSTNNSVMNNIFWRISTNGAGASWAGWSIPNAIVNLNTFAGNMTNSVDPLFVSTNTASASTSSIPNLRVSASSPAIDAGTWLTVATDAGSGAVVLPVGNSRLFYDGWGIPGETPDSIQFQGQTVPIRIASIDYDNDILYLAAPGTWTNGQGIALAYSGSAPDVGAYEGASTELPTAPSITTHPVSAAKSVGESVTFSVVATGSTPMAYQWRKDGVNIPGAALSSYTIASVTEASAGGYTCYVSNPYGNATSDIAILAVSSPAPVVTAPGKVVIRGQVSILGYVRLGAPRERVTVIVLDENGSIIQVDGADLEVTW